MAATPEDFLKKINGILSKITVASFDKLSKQFVEAITSCSQFPAVVASIFKVGFKQPQPIQAIYVKLLHRLVQDMRLIVTTIGEVKKTSTGLFFYQETEHPREVDEAATLDNKVFFSSSSAALDAAVKAFHVLAVTTAITDQNVKKIETDSSGDVGTLNFLGMLFATPWLSDTFVDRVLTVLLKQSHHAMNAKTKEKLGEPEQVLFEAALGILGRAGPRLASKGSLCPSKHVAVVKYAVECQCVPKRIQFRSEEFLATAAKWPKAVATADTKTAVAAEAATETAVAADTETAVAAEADTETAVVAEADTETAVAAEADTETAVAAEADTETAVAAEADTETAVAAEADTATAVAAETGTAVDAEADTAVEAAADTETAVEAKPDGEAVQALPPKSSGAWRPKRKLQPVAPPQDIVAADRQFADKAPQAKVDPPKAVVQGDEPKTEGVNPYNAPLITNSDLSPPSSPPPKSTPSVSMPPTMPLQSAWTMWYKSLSYQGEWQDTMKNLNTFQTVQGVWSLYNNLVEPSNLPAGASYYLFRNGVNPAWEDQHNMRGGMWVFECRANERNVDKFWLQTVLGIIGSCFPSAQDVMGAVVVIKRGKVRFQLWTKTYANETMQKDIGSYWKAQLELPASTVISCQSIEKVLKGGRAPNGYKV